VVTECFRCIGLSGVLGMEAGGGDDMRYVHEFGRERWERGVR
jgi:hypothetical protein